MTRRRRLAALGLGLALAAAALGWAGTGADAPLWDGSVEADPDAGASVVVLQWNICGAAHQCANHGGTGKGTSVARLVNEVVLRHPDLIGVNEICRGQFEALQAVFKERGLPLRGAYQQMHGNVPACGADSSYGLAVFSAEAPTGPPRYRPFTDTDGETYLAAGRTEPVLRGLLCLPTRARGRGLTFCGAHAGTADSQLKELHRWFDDPVAFPPATPVILAGDLNQQPNEGSLAGLYGHTRGEKDQHDPDGRFLEADERNRRWFKMGGTGGVRCQDPVPARCRNGAPTAEDGRKIDYIFATEAHFTAPRAVTVKVPESDHVLYEGVFQFKQ
ncbi:endonuclease/exonuclease/phosphatase family protein [Streptomyces sp. NBC_00536]|uniref:endonuclease/exonuclease/phosphatase family protein n=1 Tax=Streptomyces sp. NBC_00536 TaxID=2975769 RepID=UPI002E802308|nr:endonuclease/exonuclease/phosphatase family protein [Streptomyces sp. NBC_00536]WUC81932.1 endonuclease/exonuclease/phosphatase family protein [Streptomyces sp. NBC_00536]